MLFSHSLIKGGVHPEGRKQLSNDNDIMRLPAPKRLYISLKQHTGLPATAVVRAGDKVIAGQLIATGSGSSANLHAPQSGVVLKIATHRAAIPGGGEELMIHMLCDPERQNSSLKVDNDAKDRVALIDIIEAAGVVGMGGAVFPAATKIRSTLNKQIDTLLINGCECEPYLTCDDKVMREQSVEVIGGIRYLLQATAAPKAIIGIEDNKPEALQILTDAASEDSNIEIKSLPTHYPMGSAKQFIQALCQVEVPKGKRSTDVGVFVQNVATCAAIYNAIRYGKPMTHRVVTLSGGALEKPMNIEAPIGTLISELVASCGGLKGTASRIVIGGPMMGHTISNMHTPIIKGTSGILFLEESELPQKNSSPCVSCGRCVSVCPMGLLPNAMAELVANDDLEASSEQGLNSCLLCGSCAFICPASLPLTQYFTYAKDELGRQRKMENKAQLARRLNQQRSERLAKEATEKAAQKAAKKAQRGATRPKRTPTTAEQEI
ncbi:electron transport complex subunit RsxC [Psychromonas antarctica]|uniref:electron transport complex subunit RsxC n=1 Tax=Psychromonas antarctica TaxID=67573 RepID=UPI001EE7F27D|nr:electron transport complex subunit RsxC [Psychromonas antarctica]MCG6200820.1 electron transport complex subunit RsxC [Psychromonas antarctica]